MMGARPCAGGAPTARAGPRPRRPPPQTGRHRHLHQVHRGADEARPRVWQRARLCGGQRADGADRRLHAGVAAGADVLAGGGAGGAGGGRHLGSVHGGHAGQGGQIRPLVARLARLSGPLRTPPLCNPKHTSPKLPRSRRPARPKNPQYESAQASRFNPLGRAFAGCPDNAFQMVQPGMEPFTPLQRLGAPVRNGLKLFAVGCGARWASRPAPRGRQG